MVEDFRKYGIWFNGHHSSEFGLTVGEGKKIGFPKKKKVVVGIPHSNKNYDFSSVIGKQSYEERELVIPFNIHDTSMWTKERMYVMVTRVTNWLMGTNKKTPLYDDVMKDYYYLAEVQDAPDFDEMTRHGVLEITFKCYPFRIARLAEGNDIWDTFNFELDVFQEVVATSDMPATFKPLAVGSYATIGAYASAFDGWEKITTDFVGESRRIIEMKATTQGNSKRAYKLEGIEQFILEQDIVQSRENPSTITLINAGITGVTPRITTTNKISVIKGNTVYNIPKGTIKNNAFQLEPGETGLTITCIYPTTITFEFYKELI